MSEQEREYLVERLVRLETKIDMMMNDKSFQRRIQELEDSQKFIWRTLLTTILGGIMSLIVAIALWQIN